MSNCVVRERWANAIQNGDFVCVETWSGYRSPVGDYKGIQCFLSTDASDDELGAATLDALSHSRFVLPAPRDDVWQHPDATFDPYLYDYKKGAERYETWVADLMDRYCYKTRRALFKDMMSCSITDSNDALVFKPTRHIRLEAWEGLSKDGQQNVTVPRTSPPAKIGAALRLALSRCV